MLHTDFKERKWEEIFTPCVTVNEFRGDSAVRVTFRSCMKNISTCMAAKSLRNESRVAVSGTHSIVFPKTRQGMNLCCCSYYYACDAEARGYLIHI